MPSRSLKGFKLEVYTNLKGPKSSQGSKVERRLNAELLKSSVPRVVITSVTTGVSHLEPQGQRGGPRFNSLIPTKGIVDGYAQQRQ
ncbi:hypothetical protein EVAR_61401_1 [Eumeta japonica]|uniref:Uncharacterized protein n=1 Tax=Eumeta variegata TaxID=151549 RepID=A0A4C1YTK7_EUMVA|nr:hypothetical protein EVAR_61401_1 [Eumeta japonica]